MTKIKPRITEGRAIEDSNSMTMEEYSEIMKKQLGKDYNRFADNVISQVMPTNNSLVLEIGSGPGWAGINLVKKRPDLMLDGLEPSNDMIKVATENAKHEGVGDRCKYINGFAENMNEIKDATYDLVISRDSLHHFIDPEKVFLEVKRVLKPAGKIYIRDSRRDLNLFGKLIVNIFSRFIPNNMGKYWKSSIAASYTPQEIEEIINKIKCNDWRVNSNLMDLTILKI